jgi:DNA-binding GntR family transcriptional regulator
VHFDRLDRVSKLPLYQQLYEILRVRIADLEWQPGQMIPSEPELMATYGVSRITLRQVLDMLVRDGLIVREQGRGSFVARPTLEKGMVRIFSFTEDMRQRGLAPRTIVLAAELIPATAEVAASLGVELGEEMVRLERLRLAEDEPLAIEESHLVHRFCPGLLQFDFAVESLREVMARAYGVRWSRAHQTIRAILASEAEAALLGVQPNAALLYIERVSYSQGSTPSEFLRVRYRGDRYTLYNELAG